MNIRAESLGKRFNREWIFKKFDYEFTSDNCYAIIGPNGSGKSTLMQVLWGQTPPSNGKIIYSLAGAFIPEEGIYAHISIATPYMELIEEFTLLEMIQFHFQFKNAKKNLHAQELMEKMELTHASEKQIMNFSSGMKQRLKLGLAFFSDTPVLFLDEPTTNLDKKSIEWYQRNLIEATKSRLTLIASNQDHEYPSESHKIDLANLK